MWVSRKQVLTFTATHTPLLICMEACAEAHDLALALRNQGHNARLMTAKYVKQQSFLFFGPPMPFECKREILASALIRTTGRANLQEDRPRADLK